MAHGDAFRNPARHMRAGETEPGRWNELCIPSRAWRAYPSTVALTSDPAQVTCVPCRDILELERRAVMDEPAAPDKMPVYLSVADIAEHFGVAVDTVLHWRARYGPDRTAAELAKAPACPQPDIGLGVKRTMAGWRPERLADWDAWRKTLPGRGAGGGRPPKQA